MSDRTHRIRIEVAPDGSWSPCVSYEAVCPHDLADPTRPCWPFDLDQDAPVPLPAPQGCNVTEWVENLGGELMGGSVTFEAEADIVWMGDDGPQITLGGTDDQ